LNVAYPFLQTILAKVEWKFIKVKTVPSIVFPWISKK